MIRGNLSGLARERSQAQTEVGGEDAGEEQDGQKYYQGDDEAQGGHAYHGSVGRALVSNGENHGRPPQFTVARLVDGKGEVAGRDHPYYAIHSHRLLGSWYYLAGFPPPFVPGTPGGRLEISLEGEGDGGRKAVGGIGVAAGGRMVVLEEGLGLEQQRGLGALLRALVAAYLYGALKVDLHRVREFEGLEVGVGEDRGRGAEVLYLGEAGHELGPGDAAPLVDELDRRPFAVVRHAVPHEHVELGVVVFDREHHGHGLADLDQARHLGRPRPLADLYLHPAAYVVAGEVGPHHVQHVDGERAKRDGLLVQVVPSAPQLSRLVPNLLDLGIVLHHDNVLEVRPRPGFGPVPV